MKSWAIPYADAALVLTLLFAPAPATALFRCGEIVTADKYKYNLEALDGPHSVVTSQIQEGLMFNTTYTVDICAPLKKKGDAKSSEQCPNGSRACAIRRLIRTDGKPLDEIDKVTALAGELADHGGGHLDQKISQLSKIDPKSDKQGLRIILNGGYSIEINHVKRKQQTVIDFVCAKDLDGTEGEYESEDKYESTLVKTRADDDKKEDEDDDADKDKDKDKEGDNGGNGNDEYAPSDEVQLGIENKPSLVFNRYGPSDSDGSIDALYLTWSSKHVCRKDAGDGSDGGDDDKGGEKKPSSHWGAFTWIVLLVFLGTAAYLIFGSWLNYTRYGARGWDLLPHGDTIRDIPYLMKDWARRVLNTVQGSGSRGGYSAV